MAGTTEVQSRLQNRYHVHGVLVADTAMRVGTHTSATTLTDNPIVRNAWGEPYLPGSTAKGAMRMSVERLVLTLDLPGVRSCGLVQGSRIDCISVQDLRRREAAAIDDPTSLSAFLEEHTCATCRLFGSPALAGRIAFADLSLAVSGSSPSELRDGAPIDRDTERAHERRRFDYEVVSAGTSFVCDVTGDDLSDGDLGLLSMGMLELVHGQTVLGGGKSRGLGRCHLDLESIEHVRFGSAFRAELLLYLREGRMTKVESPIAFLTERLDALLSA